MKRHVSINASCFEFFTNLMISWLGYTRNTYRYHCIKYKCIPLYHRWRVVRRGIVTAIRDPVVRCLCRQVCDMDKVVAICERNGLVLVEDCAHACGVKWRGRQLGYHGKVRLRCSKW